MSYPLQIYYIKSIGVQCDCWFETIIIVFEIIFCEVMISFAA